MSQPNHFVSESCIGEKCTMCGKNATHKVGEEIAWDDVDNMNRHNYTAYVCCDCFRLIMGPAVVCEE